VTDRDDAAMAPEPEVEPEPVGVEPAGVEPAGVEPGATLRRLLQWPITLVLLGVVVALGVVATGHFRRGSVVLAGAVVMAMFLRLFLREDEAGLLVVRSKIVDVVLLAVLGIGLGVLAFAVPPPP
jgi:hypothetical protein